MTIPENVPYGTPLANLNMEIKDTDTGTNSVFRIELKDPPEGFTIEPRIATGHTAVSLKINKVLSSFSFLKLLLNQNRHLVLEKYDYKVCNVIILCTPVAPLCLQPSIVHNSEFMLL